MVDDPHQFVHVRLHLTRGLDRLCGEVLDGSQFVLAALDLLEYFIGLFGDLDDRVGQLFLR